MKYAESAFDHGFTEEEIDLVVSEGAMVKMATPSDKGFDRAMFVGKVYTRAFPIEVGVEYRDDDDYAFHAMKATKYYIKETGYGE